MPRVAPNTCWRTILVLAGLGIYLVLFYATPLPTIEQITGAAFRRIDYAQLLLLPEMLFGVWFGDPPAFALLDRLPVVLFAAVLVVYAASVGWVLLVAVGANRALTSLETFVFAAAVGLATISTYTLAAGLLGWLQNPMTFALPAVLTTAVFSKLWIQRGPEAVPPPRPAEEESREIGTVDGRLTAEWLHVRWLFLAAPFALVVLLGGVLPPIDFDVLQYHLQAPKEFYDQGEVTFLPHNVYANMPLGASMFALLAMGITGDWWFGALAGKTIVALTAPLTALTLLAAGRRLHSNSAGVIAAVLYLATPWTVHVATAGLAESPLAMYTMLAIYAGVLLPCAPLGIETSSRRPGIPTPGRQTEAPLPRLTRPKMVSNPAWWSFLHRYPNTLVAGYLAGAAAGCKYPAVLFVVVPLLAWTALGSGTHAGASDTEPANARSGNRPPSGFSVAGFFARWKPVPLFLCAVMLGGGLWYAKNWFFTGNPTYPLLYEIFGDSTGTWTPDRNAQWDRVHSPGEFSAAALARDLYSVFLASEWLSPLLFPLALLAIAFHRPRRTTTVLVGYVVWGIAAWWLLTHRIDRFWIPLLTVAALLAGIGAAWSGRTWWRRVFLTLFVLTSLTNLLVVVAPAPGHYKRFFLPLERARTDPLRVNAWHRHFNANPPDGAVLLVGDAAVFDLDVPILYSTCFDQTPLRRLVGTGSPEEMRRRFAAAGVSHVLVHWGEIARYRATYGFDPWIQPALFEALVAQNVLAPLASTPESQIRTYEVVRDAPVRAEGAVRSRFY